MIVTYAIHAFRGTETLFTQGMCIAPSLSAAESIARDVALRRYPSAEGYFNHSTHLLAVPDEWLPAVAVTPTGGPCAPVDGRCVALFERCWATATDRSIACAPGAAVAC